MATQAAAPSAWHLVYDEFTHKHWRGYAGNWFMFAKGRPQPLQLKALRTFKFHDEGHRFLTHRNVYDAPAVLTPKQREADGLWEQSWERSPDDAGYSTAFALTDRELTCPDERPVRRMVALDRDAYIGACPRQPAAGWAPAQWAIELFLRGGDGTRWSFGAVYPGPGAPMAAEGAAPYQLSMHFLIQERWAGEVPDTPIDLGTIPFFEPRSGRLSERPSEWLPSTALSGTRREASVLQDGGGGGAAALSAVSQGPVATWEPPVVPAGHDLILLPDLMYAVVPSALPFGEPKANGDSGGCAAGPGELVFEFGGLMRDGGGLRRVRAEYPPGGTAGRFSFEALGGAS